MTEKYFTRFQGDDIVVTRKSDRKTVAVSRTACANTGIKGVAVYWIAIAIAKSGDDAAWR